MSQTPGDGSPMRYAAHADRMLKAFMETYVPPPEKTTPRGCGTCCYCHYSGATEPCAKCLATDGYSEWVPMRIPSKSAPKQAKPVHTATTASEQNPLDIQVAGDHYKKLKIQPVEYIHANGIPFIEGNVIKYVTRWRDKGGVKDLEKARHFLDLLIELEAKGVAK